MKTIYVLLVDWNWDKDGMGLSHKMYAFNDLAAARQEMEKQVEEWKEMEADIDDLVEEGDEDSHQLYEEGWYDMNHIAWCIEQVEVK